MARFSSSFIAAAAAVLFSGSTALASENSGVCGEQAKCISPSIGNCIGGQRQICLLYRPGFEGCDKGWGYAFPDVCTVTDTTFPWKRGWGGRVCHSIKPADGTSVTFSVRDETACSGEATDFSHFSTTDQLSAVAHCSPGESEMCDMKQYTSAYFDSNPTFSTLMPKACKWTITAGSCASDTMCCQTEDASCQACRAGFSVQDFCLADPETDGCPPKTTTKEAVTKKMCCDGMEASCEACHADLTIEEYCAVNPDMDGCPKICCMAMEPSCLACAADQTIEEYCEDKPHMDGCTAPTKSPTYRTFVLHEEPIVHG